MYISHVLIKNYRNLVSVDVELQKVVAVIGENNSGKSNLMRALSLPLTSDEVSYTSKNLFWSDISNEAKGKYYEYIINNQQKIVSGEISAEELYENVPKVLVELTFMPGSIEKYDVKDFGCEIEDGEIRYKIRYTYCPKMKDFYDWVKSILSKKSGITGETIDEMKLNLLPMELYSYTITVPGKGDKVAYDTLRNFKYTALEAERDDFSISNDKLGSKSLVKLLQLKMDEQSRLEVEAEYAKFFETIKTASNMEQVINWQDNTEVRRAKDFFEKIDILPNMPTMYSLLNSVKLGYDGESLSSQGLGYRNLLLMLVLINSLSATSKDVSLDLLTVEEPEAHLCISNIHLMNSFINAFSSENERIQIIYSTHDPELLNKIDLSNIIVLHNGDAFSLSEVLTDETRSYLSKNPNTDIYKLLFSRRCILVEGITEELLIKSYIRSKNELSDIEVISFHKGYKDIIEIWLKVNKKSNNRLGIIRDFDNQENAKNAHEAYNSYKNICVRTTKGYTLETDIVNTGNNADLLRKRYGSEFGWEHKTNDEIENDWRTSKSFVMFKLCKDISRGDIEDFEMPSHIKDVLDFMISETKE